MKGCWIFFKGFFCIFWYDDMVFCLCILHCIMFIALWMLHHPCIPEL
jgi:hypothetical protein